MNQATIGAFNVVPAGCAPSPLSSPTADCDPDEEKATERRDLVLVTFGLLFSLRSWSGQRGAFENDESFSDRDLGRRWRARVGGDEDDRR